MGFMTDENHCDTSLCLKVVAEAEPGVLARVLGQFQNLNIVPRRVSAELSTSAVLHVQIEVFGLPETRLTLIAAKVGQLPAVLNAYWHRL
jgi:(p)ppGpp synthase/HD superfamily hydrolase